MSKRLQESFATRVCATQARHFAIWHRVHCVGVVPAQFRACFDVTSRKKGDMMQAYILCVHKHTLYEHIWRTAVIEPATYVATLFSVHYVHVCGFLELLHLAWQRETAQRLEEVLVVIRISGIQGRAQGGVRGRVFLFVVVRVVTVQANIVEKMIIGRDSA